ncbi:hypothetical protein BT93_K1104 [Corymbia citriodora subsp. variegata]|nr:hypothetical protein BT93_K1104 [Corymbia citriodora subsp. variegata]
MPELEEQQNPPPPGHPTDNPPHPRKWKILRGCNEKKKGVEISVYRLCQKRYKSVKREEEEKPKDRKERDSVQASNRLLEHRSKALGTNKQDEKIPTGNHIEFDIWVYLK